MPKSTGRFLELTPVLAQAMIYSDNIVLVADSEEALQTFLDEWNEEMKIRGLQINPKSKRKRRAWNWNLETIKNKDGKIDQYVLNRVKANGVYHQIFKSFIGKQEVSRDVRIRIFKSVFLPVLLFGSERWTALDKHVERITSAEMRFLKRIVGKTRRD
ncbi:uncharacterized protein [Halyomorpha halys]|uniref:uncharacterized protein n=1 Tax=Halyomorpha halys TaxID=286706 RepID=UPI0006D4CF01|nr:uncharacterized protein LOC106677881 [Halyomorpha halys]